MARNDIALDIAHAIVIPKDLDFSNNTKEQNDHHHHSITNNNNNAVTTDCKKCKKSLKGGDLAVVAPRFALRDFWHPGCFSCATCDELLVDLAYCVFDDTILCERHYAENFKPRCAACDELIFAGQYTKVRIVFLLPLITAYSEVSDKRTVFYNRIILQKV